MTTADMIQAQCMTRRPTLKFSPYDERSDGVTTQSTYFRAKGILDAILGLGLLIIALPVIGLLIAVVRITSRGPGIFRQLRVGKGGQIYTMYKLRSMRIDAELSSGPVWSPSGSDPRVTWLGNWLRRLHLDELPQLFNVVRGEMSLIGPRPERPEFVSVLGGQIPDYLDRLMVPPGITGLAQINLPPDTDLNSVRRKLILDCDYICTANPWLDLRILVCTALRMVSIKGPTITCLLGLDRTTLLATADTEIDRVQPELPVSLKSLAGHGAGHVAAREISDLEVQTAD